MRTQRELDASTAEANRQGLLEQVPVWSRYLTVEAREDNEAATRWAYAAGQWFADACMFDDPKVMHDGYEALRDGSPEAYGTQGACPQLSGMVSALGEVAHAALTRGERQADAGPTGIPTDFMAMLRQSAQYDLSTEEQSRVGLGRWLADICRQDEPSSLRKGLDALREVSVDLSLGGGEDLRLLGAATALVEVAQAALARAEQDSLKTQFPFAEAEPVLLKIADTPDIADGALAEALGWEPEQIIPLANWLSALGLVVDARSGTCSMWSATALGQEVAKHWALHSDDEPL
ncbi:hypothetical protein [Nonomuraea dietziae]|uniref:Uncharacterized protein n=3 Tax=Nonomuraea dietziae TaxID=65515 RepID=A0A7W5VLS9_9ACTN|nr:hypothetical protein [Nonomuraea dietziae]MBB3733750.1 hypothetical protein [Nonomuraea dietziae]